MPLDPRQASAQSRSAGCVAVIFPGSGQANGFQWQSHILGERRTIGKSLRSSPNRVAFCGENRRNLERESAIMIRTMPLLLLFLLIGLPRIFSQNVGESVFENNTAQEPTVQSKTLQERLGYRPSARLLVIHADDLGMSH